MKAYHYQFTSTGDAGIDSILAAVAEAGKLHHSTEYWRDKAWDGGPSPVEVIQAAADKAASKEVEYISLSHLNNEIATLDNLMHRLPASSIPTSVIEAADRIRATIKILEAE